MRHTEDDMEQLENLIQIYIERVSTVNVPFNELKSDEQIEKVEMEAAFAKLLERISHIKKR